MENLLSEMQSILSNEIAERHSYFQMKYFIVNKEPTTQAKMWQCLREIKARYESLEAIDMEIEDSKDNLELIDLDINKLNRIFEKKSKDFNVEKLRRFEIHLKKINRKRFIADKNLQILQKKKKYIEEEAKFFVVLFKGLEQVEPLKNYDDINVQKEYWGEKLLQKINLKMLMQSHVDTELIETVLSLPDDVPIKMQTIKNLDNRHQQMLEMKNQTERELQKKQEKNGN
jgi:hypothetical protein